MTTSLHEIKGKMYELMINDNLFDMVMVN